MPEAHVQDNYRRLKAERGLTWEQLAQQAASTDRGLAAWMREQSQAETGTDKPKGRREQPTEIA